MYGGSLVIENTELTWVVMLLCWIGSNKGKLCTGSVIHPKWVLTAGHCVHNNGTVAGPYDVFVFVYHAINSYTNFDVQDLFVHPRFLSDGANVHGSNGDMALIKTWQPMGVGVARLNTDPKYYPAEKCQIAGFGRKGKNFEESKPTLHTMMGVGPCIGDSGSPLVCGGQIAGVLSSGRLQGPPVCGANTTNGILFYEPVADYLSWIRAVQEANSKAVRMVSGSGTASILVASWLPVFLSKYLF